MKVKQLLPICGSAPGFAKFKNEVQHQSKVLPWDIDNWGSRNGVSIARLQAQGTSQRQIAADLGRAPSTIARELKRSSLATRGYDPEEAQRRSRPRHVGGAVRLAREAGRQVISYESIYRFIDGQLRRPKNTGGAQSPLSTRYRKLQWTVDAETRTL